MKSALNPAYELSFLQGGTGRPVGRDGQQTGLLPSLQAQRLKKCSQEGHLTLDMMRVIMGEKRGDHLDRVTFTSDTFAEVFPKSYAPADDAETIIKLLEAWQKKRQRPGTMKGPPMRDISARELKGHKNSRRREFWDNTRWMIGFSVLRPSTAYGSPERKCGCF